MQEILVVPIGAGSVAEAEQLNLAIHRAVGKRLSNILSYPLGKGDEGGWAPGITDEEALLVVSEEVGRVQDDRGKKIRVGLDVAAGSLYDEKKGGYYYRSTGRTLSREQQIAFIGEIRDKFNLMYIEDPLDRGRLRGICKAPLLAQEHAHSRGRPLHDRSRAAEARHREQEHQRGHSQGEPDRHAFGEAARFSKARPRRTDRSSRHPTGLATTKADTWRTSVSGSAAA